MSDHLRVADVFRASWHAYNQTHKIAPHQRKAVRHLLRCRTSQLGGHIYRCDGCGSEVPLYNSCQSRHCPTCQSSKKEQWLDARREELLPVTYFHTVFTLPHDLNGLLDANRKLLIGELFSTVNWVLQHFAADPRWRLVGVLGFIAMLHTWTQKLQAHFHLHCIVPGGVWRKDTREWIHCRRTYLFSKAALAAAFRNRYIKRLSKLRKRGKLAYRGAAAELAEPAAWDTFIAKLQNTQWIVYPKHADGKAEQVLEYMGRYTHKVGITDSRILSVAERTVTFSWRDRKDGNKKKPCTLEHHDFIKRFLYHILPDGMQKVRYYGWLSAANRKRMLPAIREALGAETHSKPEQSLAERILERTGIDITQCPHCTTGHLRKTDERILPMPLPMARSP